MRRLAPALVVAAVALSPAAHANKIKRFSLGNPHGFEHAPELEVYSLDGERWTTVDATDTSKVTVALSAECQWEGRGNKAYRGSLSVPGFALVGQREPANFLIPHASEASGVFRWDGGQGQTFDPVKACNDELDRRVANAPGRTRHHFLAEGFRVDYPAALRASYQLTCKPTGAGFTDIDTKSVMINTRVKCAASPLAEAKIPAAEPKPERAPIRPRRAPPLLAAASFEADPEVHTGACPTPIRFVGTMTATRAGTVTYRYTSHDGRTSPEFQLSFAGPGTLPTRDWQRTVAPPDARTTLAAPGADAGTVEGWMRLDVLSPAPRGQIVARYRAVCGDVAEETEEESTPPERARRVQARPAGG